VGFCQDFDSVIKKNRIGPKVFLGDIYSLIIGHDKSYYDFISDIPDRKLQNPNLKNAPPHL
jgi:hypothetical protein